MGIKADGSLWGWGYNGWGNLGDGTTITRTIPTQIGTEKNWLSVSVTMHSTLALKSDGTIWSWGHNGSGRLGRGFDGGDYSDRKQIGTSKDWKSISCGSHFCLALQKDGGIYAWGVNGSGQLGDSTSNSLFSPKKIGAGFTSIYAGDQTSAAIKNDSTIWIWGRNDQGLYGDGTTTAYKYPTQTVSSAGWKSVVLGYIHILGLKYDGTIYGWGNGTNGSLGDSSWNHRYSPFQIKSLKKVKMMTGGSGFSIVLNDSGSLYGFGNNSYYQCGLGNTNSYNYPQIVIKNFAVKNFALYRSLNPISDTASTGLVSNSIQITRRIFDDTWNNRTN